MKTVFSLFLVIMITQSSFAQKKDLVRLCPAGGHGYGLRPGNYAAETWPGLAEKWMKRIIKSN